MIVWIELIDIHDVGKDRQVQQRRETMLVFDKQIELAVDLPVIGRGIEHIYVRCSQPYYAARVHRRLRQCWSRRDAETVVLLRAVSNYIKIGKQRRHDSYY